METFLIYFLFVVGIVLIVKGGDAFVDAASWMAEVSGIPKFIVGATIVSVATTLPELIVSSIAASNGQNEMAIGNAIGSVTANTGLIMAISLIFMPLVIKRRQFAFKGLMLTFAVVILWLLSFTGTSLGNSFGDVGGNLTVYESMVLLVIFVVFIAENIYSAKRNNENAGTAKPTTDKKTVTLNIIKFILGAAAIVIGSDLLVDKGTLIARNLGVSESIISLTAIAIGTSLPELVTTVSAVIKKEPSLSVGNILGANLLDTVLILPVCSIISGGAIEVTNQTLWLDIPVCLGITLIAVVPTLFAGKFRRFQGVVMIALYIAYLVAVCSIK